MTDTEIETNAKRGRVSEDLDEGRVTENANGEAVTEPDRRLLWIVLEIDVGSDCPLVRVEEPILDVDLQHMGGMCRSEVVTGKTDVDIRHFEQPMGDSCIANVFFAHDCVPHVTGTSDESILVTLHPEDRSSIPKLLEGLDEIGYDARLDRVVRLDEDLLGMPPVLCDFGLLTEKQQEALTLAVERGYYAQSRKATLSELAAELDIGKSAVSHRLQAAESKIIRNYLPRTDSL
jgi:hypothetical protein